MIMSRIWKNIQIYFNVSINRKENVNNVIYLSFLLLIRISVFQRKKVCCEEAAKGHSILSGEARFFSGWVIQNRIMRGQYICTFPAAGRHNSLEPSCNHSYV